MFTLPQLNHHWHYFCAWSATVTPSGLAGPSLPLFGFVAFNFDLFTLSPPLPITLINRPRAGHMRLWLIQPWHWPLIFILSRCFPWPLTSELEPAAVWTSSSSTWPLSPPFRWYRWITVCSGHLQDYIIVPTESIHEAPLALICIFLWLCLHFLPQAV